MAAIGHAVIDEQLDHDLACIGQAAGDVLAEAALPLTVPLPLTVALDAIPRAGPVAARLAEQSFGAAVEHVVARRARKRGRGPRGFDGFVQCSDARSGSAPARRSGTPGRRNANAAARGSAGRSVPGSSGPCSARAPRSCRPPTGSPRPAARPESGPGHRLLTGPRARRSARRAARTRTRHTAPGRRPRRWRRSSDWRAMWAPRPAWPAGA